MYGFLILPVLAVCTFHLVIFDLVKIFIFGEQYKLRSSSFVNIPILLLFHSLSLSRLEHLSIRVHDTSHGREGVGLVVVTLCELVSLYQHSGDCISQIGGSVFRRNIFVRLRVRKALQPKRPTSVHSLYVSSSV
jgi:hypothetical protein